ncbi:MAG: sodium-dependent bicarbonate transport family permease [Planctomycetaceae bacterium]
MSILETLQSNLLTPLALAFALGIFAKIVKSDLALPKDLYSSLSIYLLLAIGLKGGVELSHVSLQEFMWPAIVTLCLGLITPVTAFLTLRHIGRFSIADSAGIAAHYGSVSAVTFMAATQFVKALNVPMEAYMPTLVTIMESPGIATALLIGVVLTSRQTAVQTARVTAGGAVAGGPGMGLSLGGTTKTDHSGIWKAMHEVLTGRSMILMLGGMLIGYIIRTSGYEPVKPLFEGCFRGALTLFLLEMGLVAGSKLSDLKRCGPFLIAFGILMPIIHGAMGVCFAHWAGMSVGGCTVLGTMAASASYIAAPPAVRMSLPEANPTLFLTLALGITFPFNLLAGIPIYYRMACYLAG